jgi:ketosteroid isomerase-like protein
MSTTLANPEAAMSKNKQTVQQYMEAFNRTDHAAILSCLTDDVEWVLPGVFHLKGKEAFDKEIENPAFTGSPVIKITRMIEEGDIVMAEGTVRAQKKDGPVLNLVFSDVFEMRDGKIRKLISYLMEVKE